MYSLNMQLATVIKDSLPFEVLTHRGEHFRNVGILWFGDLKWYPKKGEDVWIEKTEEGAYVIVGRPPYIDEFNRENRLEVGSDAITVTEEGKAVFVEIPDLSLFLSDGEVFLRGLKLFLELLGFRVSVRTEGESPSKKLILETTLFNPNLGPSNRMDLRIESSSEGIKITLKHQGDIDTEIDGDVNFSIEGSVKLSAVKDISIETNDSLSMKSDKNISLQASDQTTIRGNTVILRGSQIKAYNTGAAVPLAKADPTTAAIKTLFNQLITIMSSAAAAGINAGEAYAASISAGLPSLQTSVNLLNSSSIATTVFTAE